MKFCITFTCPAPVSLPVSYNHILQAALLAWLQDEEYTTFLHDGGYRKERRTFKLYSFSELLGKHHYEDKKIVFEERVSVYLSSYMEEMQEYVEASLDAGRPLKLGKLFLPPEAAYIVEDEFEDCYVQALSPIAIHSTFELPTGTRKTYYYEPQEKDFSVMLRDNLVRKYEAAHGRMPEDTSFALVPLKDGGLKKQIRKYRDTVIIGWTGRFRMCGSAELIKMALLAGAGARNSMGFGFLVQIEKREDEA